MSTEGELVQQAKGYDGGRSADAKREVDSYFENFRGRDTPANRGIVMSMNPPEVQLEMQQLFDQADGKVIPMDDALVLPDAARGTSRDAGQAETGRTVVRERGLLEGTGADPMVQEKAGIRGGLQAVQDAREGQLEGREQRVAANEAQRRGSMKVPPPGAEPSLVPPQLPSGPGYDIVASGVAPLRSTQATDQGVVEPEQARQLRDYSMREQMRASYETQSADYQANQERLRLSNERMAKLNEMARQDADFQARQNRIAEDAEQRIAAAEQALKEAEVDPNFNPMREIFEGDDWGKKILMGLGAMFGGVGASITGGPNQFFEQYNLAVNRKIDLMEKRYQARKDQLGAAQDGYARMRQILQDQAATRAMIEARAWQMFDAELDKIGMQYNLATNNAQYRMVRSQVAEKIRDKVMETARTTQHAAAVEEQFRPQVVVPTGGDGGKQFTENLAKFDEERHKRGITEREAVMDLIGDAVSSSLSDPAARQEFAQFLMTGQPGRIRQLVANMAAKDPQALQSLASGLAIYGHSLYGAALTAHEINQRTQQLAKGGTKDWMQFLDMLRARHRNEMSGLIAVYPNEAQEYYRRKGIVLKTGAAEYETRPVRGGN